MSDAEKPELRANDNPWYCLATLYGEQPAGLVWDKVLAAKNRMAWNRWMAGVLSDEKCAELVRNGFSEAELLPLTPVEKGAFCNAFASRTGREKELPPDLAGIINFNYTHFDRLVIFDGFLFPGDAYFSSATFAKDATFSSATFSGDANFSSATFSGSTLFDSAMFSEGAYFGSATFSGGTYFGSATFSGITYFGSATFSGYANFSSATFSMSSNPRLWKIIPVIDKFSSAPLSKIFPAIVNFSSATFFHVDFTEATFSDDAGFVNAEFTANAFFAHARFETSVPDFRGARMHEATEWHGINWPPAPQDKDSAQAQVYAYERLKQEMERLKKHEDEQFFFRKELRARRGLIPPLSGAWLLNYLYEASSDYGQSISRPLLWLFVLFVIGCAIFAGAPVFKGTRMTIPGAAGLSFANIFSFLPLTREIMTAEMAAGLSTAAKIVGVVQSILGALLLFLLGLALRTRFRMR
jgi:uncharacterized protein YjbI with pentapeptide repeats